MSYYWIWRGLDCSLHVSTQIWFYCCSLYPFGQRFDPGLDSIKTTRQGTSTNIPLDQTTNAIERLPSFTELTSDFNPTLGAPIDDSRQTHRPPGTIAPPRGPRSVQNLPRAQHHHTRQQIPRPQSHHLGHHPANVLQMQPMFQSQLSRSPPQPLPQEFNYRFPLSPIGATEQLLQPSQGSLPSVPPNVGYIATGRRQSVQLPFRHQQSNSYDSQTSLSTLADIASSGTMDLQGLLSGMENLLDVHKRLNILFRDINGDFDANLDHPGHGARLKLHHLHYDHQGRPIHEMSAESVHAVANNIPVPALKAALGMVADLKTFLDQWLIYREQQPQRRTAGGERPQPEPRGVITQPLEKNEEKLESPEIPISHKRQKSGQKRKDDNVSLVVKPPTPVTTTGVQPRDDLNEHLSARSDQVCKQCGSNDTPEWRRGPYGVRSLCNACGLFFSKLSRKVGNNSATAIMLERRERGDGDDRRLPT